MVWMLDGDGDIGPYKYKRIDAVTKRKADQDGQSGANEQDDDRPYRIAETPATPFIFFQCYCDVDESSNGYLAEVQAERQLDEPHFSASWLRRTGTYIYGEQGEQV